MRTRIGYEFASKMQASRCLFHDFYDLTHFLHHIFSKLLFLPRRGAQFCKAISCPFDWKFYVFDPQTASIRAFFVIWFALFVVLAVPIAIFSLHALFKILLLAAVRCVFRPQSPVSKNDRMHHTYMFVDFLCHRLFFLPFHCFTHHLLQLFEYFW